MPLFDLAPKQSPELLFGREEELDRLVRLVRQNRWAVVLGPRMVGKTSLVQAAVRTLKRPTVYVNLWGTRGIPGLIEGFVGALNTSPSLIGRVRRFARRVQGVSVGPAGITLAPSARRLRTLQDLVTLIGEEAGRSVVVLDEVQELAGISGQFLRLLANVFNTHPEVAFVFTGSHFGLLRTLLAPSADSPLYGRPPARLELGPFEPETSVEFLLRGFREYRLAVPRSTLQGAVERSLDGIPGWLTLYGNSVAVQRLSPPDAERATVREGVKVARSELTHFLASRPVGPYWAALRALVPGASWGEVRDRLNLQRGAPVNDNTVARILRALKDANLAVAVEGRYTLPDPMVRAFVRSARRPPR